MTEIETDRLLLRRWREEDLDAYTRICADPEVMRYMGGPRTRQRCEEQIAWFVQHWEERGFGLWAVEEKATGAFIGRIGLLCHDDWPEDEHKTEVGWLLERSFWGRGLATEGARAACATVSRSSTWSASSASYTRRIRPRAEWRK